MPFVPLMTLLASVRPFTAVAADAVVRVVVDVHAGEDDAAACCSAPTPVPTGVVPSCRRRCVFWIVPPVQPVVFALVQVPAALPVTVSAALPGVQHGAVERDPPRPRRCRRDALEGEGGGADVGVRDLECAAGACCRSCSPAPVTFSVAARVGLESPCRPSCRCRGRRPESVSVWPSLASIVTRCSRVRRRGRVDRLRAVAEGRRAAGVARQRDAAAGVVRVVDRAGEARRRRRCGPVISAVWPEPLLKVPGRSRCRCRRRGRS